jgi:hypothetical protein
VAGTLTIISGLCGSGKSWLLNHLHKQHPKSVAFDEQLSDRGKPGISRREQVARALNSGKDVFIADLWAGWPPRRRTILRHLRKLVPNLRIVWLVYENDIRKANRNCRARPDRDPRGHMKINRKWAPLLEPPKNAVILRIYNAP